MKIQTEIQQIENEVKKIHTLCLSIGTWITDLENEYNKKLDKSWTNPVKFSETDRKLNSLKEAQTLLYDYQEQLQSMIDKVMVNKQPDQPTQQDA